MPLIVWLVVALVLAGCDGGSAPRPTPTFTGTVRIGVAAPYTGDTADGGIQILQGAQLAADEANANGGILGNRIEIVSVDDEANSNKATAVASQLLESNVVAVVGHKDSGVSIPASEVYNRAGILQITPTSSNPIFTARGLDTVFRVCPVDTTQGPYLADFLINKLGQRKIAVINANTAYGQGLAAEFTRRASELGVEPVKTTEIKRGDKDFATQLGEIKPLAPEAIFYAGSLPEAIIIVSQMKELGIEATFIGGDTLFQAEFVVRTASAGEGAYVSSFFPDVQTSGDDASKRWAASYRAAFKRNPGGNSAGGYVAAQTLFEAMRQANSTDPVAVKTALKNLKMDSIIGPIEFDGKGDLKDQRGHLKLFQVRDGAFQPVEP
jgi:branched-chain amino acid transport system substrate-binding protein